MKKLSFVIVTLIIFNCDLFQILPFLGSETFKPNEAQNNSGKQSIDSIRIVTSGWDCRNNTPGKDIEIVRDDDSYKKMLSKFRLENDSSFEKVDFKNEIIVAIRDGRKPSSGYELQFQSVVETPDTLFIITELLLPGKCPVDGGFTDPYVIGAIPKTNKKIKIIFTERERASVSAKVVYKGNCSSCKNSENTLELLNDQAAYHETLRNIGIEITADLKSVDFNNVTIVKVVIGQRYKSSFVSLSLKDVGEGDGFYGYSLQVELAFPGNNCPVDGLLTRPYFLVAVPKTQKDICLLVDESIVDCQ